MAEFKEKYEVFLEDLINGNECKIFLNDVILQKGRNIR